MFAGVGGVMRLRVYEIDRETGENRELHVEWQRAERLRIAFQASREHRRALLARRARAEADPNYSRPFPGRGYTPSDNRSDGAPHTRLEGPL
jgi:hypothetical protein